MFHSDVSQSLTNRFSLICPNLNQMLHSNVSQPKTNVHSLMWSPLYSILHALHSDIWEIIFRIYKIYNISTSSYWASIMKLMDVNSTQIIHLHAIKENFCYRFKYIFIEYEFFPIRSFYFECFGRSCSFKYWYGNFMSKIADI